MSDSGTPAGGDADTLRALIREHTGSVLVWVRRYAHGPDEAEDLAQEVWRRVVLRWERHRFTGSVRGWLYAVTRTVCLDAARRDASRRRAEAGAALESAHEGVAAGGAGLPAADPTGPVRVALDALPPRQRETVTLRILDRLTTRETAEAMGCSPGTVKAALSQGLANLRRHFGAHPTSPEDLP